MRFIILLFIVTATAACGPHPIANTHSSPDALAREVLSALAKRDEAQLRTLAITEEEFEQRVWPGLPAARPERNMPWSYVWLDLCQKSNGMLKRSLAAHGGRRYELDSVKFQGATTNHGNYRVFRETVLMVRDSSGASHELRVLGSMIEADGGWKVFSYVVDQ